MRLRNFSLLLVVILVGCLWWVAAQNTNQQSQPDAVTMAQQSQPAPEHSQPDKMQRPEQEKNEHDRSNVFTAPNAKASSPVFKGQAKEGKISGFDFYRDALGSDAPNQNPDEGMKQLMADRPKVMQAQRALLESRYNLVPKLDPQAKMSRGKPLAVGPTAKLKGGMTWEQLAAMTPDQIRDKDAFPYPALPSSFTNQWGAGFSSSTDSAIPTARTSRRGF